MIQQREEPQVQALVTQLRHTLHRHPELSGQEVWTRGYLMDFLRAHTALEVVDNGSWFYAAYRAGRGHGIAFRADFDALPIPDNIDTPYCSQVPGVGHKCGHDGHSAALAALALEVDRDGADRDVFFLFQHAEETGAGAEECLGLLEAEQVEEIYAFHNMSGYPRGAVCVRPGTMHCASRGAIITLTGVPAHASTPELGRNPALAAARLVEALPQLSRWPGQRGLVLATVVGVRVGEGDFGVSAFQGELRLTLRAQYEEELDQLQGALEGEITRLAAAEGLDWSVALADVFPETVNHPACVEKIRRAARALEMPLVELEAPERCSEDFGHYLKRIPGAIFFLGNGEDYPGVHDVRFDFLDEQLAQASRLFRAILDQPPGAGY